MNGYRGQARAAAPPLGQPRERRHAGLDFGAREDGKSVARWFPQSEVDAAGPAYPVELACAVIPEWRDLAGTDMDQAVKAHEKGTHWEFEMNDRAVAGGDVAGAPDHLEVPIACYVRDGRKLNLFGFCDGVHDALRWLGFEHFDGIHTGEPVAAHG